MHPITLRHFIGQVVCAAFTHGRPVRGLWGELRCHRCGGIMGFQAQLPPVGGWRN